jgi:hypothetical protein
MAITSKAMNKDLKDHRIETLETQVKDLYNVLRLCVCLPLAQMFKL